MEKPWVRVGLGKWIGMATTVLLMLTCSLAAEGTYYVAPGGDDAWSGMLAEPNADRSDGPLATLDGARIKVREEIGKGLNQPVTVMIRGGEYMLDQTVIFDPEDSGTADCPVTYQAFQAEGPVFTGGRKLSNWKKVTANPKGVHRKAKGNLWYWEMPAALKGKWQITSLYNGIKLMPRAESSTYRVSKDHKQDEANAKLIAVSPMMLEALSGLLQLIREEDLPDNGELSGAAICDLARSAAAIATGDEGWSLSVNAIF